MPNELIGILCFAVGTTVCFWQVSRLAGTLMLLHDVWLVYLLLLNCAVFFCV